MSWWRHLSHHHHHHHRHHHYYRRERATSIRHRELSAYIAANNVTYCRHASAAVCQPLNPRSTLTRWRCAARSNGKSTRQRVRVDIGTTPSAYCSARARAGRLDASVARRLSKRTGKCAAFAGRQRSHSLQMSVFDLSECADWSGARGLSNAAMPRSNNASGISADHALLFDALWSELQCICTHAHT